MEINDSRRGGAGAPSQSTGIKDSRKEKRPIPKAPRATPQYEAASITDLLISGVPFSDRVGAAGYASRAALERAIFGDGPTFSEAYDTALRTKRGQVDQAKKERPFTAAALQALGTVGSFGSQPGFFTGGTTLAGKMGRGAGAGAIEGGIIGASEGKGGFANVAESAAEGMAIGGVTGGVVPPIASVIQRGGRLVNSLLPSEKGLRDKAARIVTQAALDDGVDLVDAANQAAQSGKPVMLADQGANLKNLTRGVATAPGPQQQAVQEAFADRRLDQAERLVKDINETLGGGPTAYRAIQEITERRAAQSKPLYEAAFGPLSDPRFINDPATLQYLTEVANAPAIKSAWAKARTQIMNKASKERASTGGNFVPLPVPKDLRTALQSGQVPYWHIDQLKRALDDRIGASLKSGETTTASDFMSFKRDLLELMDNANPQYARARSVYADASSQKSAIELGKSFERLEAEEIKDITARMSAAERDYFRLGVADALKRKVKSWGDNMNAANAVGRSPLKREKLRPVFASDEQYEKFINNLGVERKMADVENEILAGSKTADKLEGVARASGQGEGGIGDLMEYASTRARQAAVFPRATMLQVMSDGAKAATNRVVGGVGPQTRGEVGKLLLQREPNQIGNIYDMLAAQAEKQRADQMRLQGLLGGVSLGATGELIRD